MSVLQQNRPTRKLMFASTLSPWSNFLTMWASITHKHIQQRRSA